MNFSNLSDIFICMVNNIGQYYLPLTQFSIKVGWLDFIECQLLGYFMPNTFSFYLIFVGYGCIILGFAFVANSVHF